MKRNITLFLLSFLTVTNCLAGKFIVSDGNGFPNSNKANYILFENVKKGAISYQSDSLPLKNLKCFKLTLKEDNQIDTTEIADSIYVLSTDSQSVTIKNLSANTGYLVKYTDNSYGSDIESYAYTCVVNFQPITSVKFPQDTVICKDLELTFEPVMEYFNEYGNKKKIERDLSIKYKSFLLRGETPSEEDVTFQTSASKSVILDSFPYVNTPFEVTDLTAKEQLKMSASSFVTDTFFTQAVVAYPTLETSGKYEHEGDDGTDTTIHFFASHDEAIENVKNFRNSGPLFINLNSYANDITNHYEWAFSDGEQAQKGDYENAYTYFDKYVNAFKISDPGMHCIELTVSNIRNDSVCEHRSYGCVFISESKLYIPNAFTPNGDGTNDEFRVGYRSIEKFEMTIYDQWGRRIYKSDDITKGWDGTFKGDRSAIGAYYYVIKAKGTDGEEYNKTGTISLIRTKE